MEASDAGQKSIEHLTEISVTCSSQEQELRSVENWNSKYQKQMLETYDEAKCVRLFSRFKKNGTWQVRVKVALQEKTPILEKCCR